MDSNQIVHITANSRLTSSIKQNAVLQANTQVVNTPLVMTLEQWWQDWQNRALLQGVFAEQKLPGKILNNFEAQWLFEQSLQELLDQQDSTEEHNGFDEQLQQQHLHKLALLNIGATAKQLYQAWTLSQEWLPENWSDDHYLSAESLLFVRCAKRYQSKLAAHNWLDKALFSKQRLLWLAESLASQQGKALLPAKFVLHGFDDLTPNIRAWQYQLEQAGIVVEMLGKPVPLGNDFELQYQQLGFYQAQDIYDEALQAVLWAVEHLKAQLQQVQQKYGDELSLAKQQALQSIRIALIAPDLNEYKALLRQLLDETLAQYGWDELQALQARGGNTIYNFSLGEPLLQMPLVHNALLSLNLAMQPYKSMAYQQFSDWLISPYTLGDMIDRQQADSELRQLQWANIVWLKLLEHERAKSLPKSLFKALNKLVELHQSQAHKLSLNEFADYVWQVLDVIGWPGSKTLSSIEQQQRQALENALQEFAGLGELGGKQPCAYWLSLLNRFIAEKVHQVQSTAWQPIQIVGMLEAGGQQFTAIWLMGLTNEAWPRAAKPNAFLPHQLQCQYGLPRSDAQRELYYAQQISQRLADSCQLLIWSYPAKSGEAELLPTPILPGVSQQAAVFEYLPQAYSSLAQNVFAQQSSNALDWQEDSQGLPIVAGEKAPGGAGILQAQSQCPLMAYIDYRLGVKYGLQTVEDSLANTNQGTLIHAVLEHFWLKLKTQVAMLSKTDEELTAILKEHIGKAFDELQLGLDEGLMTVEKQRILELCLQWLELEKQRDAFSVESTEKSLTLELAGIEFKIIIDRIDDVMGQKFIVDYKTGKASVNALLDTPIKAPQLAVYLFAVEDAENTMAGLGYGLLRSDEAAKLSALIADNDSLMSDAKNPRSIQVFSKLAEKEGGDFYQCSWQDFISSLKQEVLALAEQIQQGYAPLQFDKDADIAYAKGDLALRLPEAQIQWNQAVKNAVNDSGEA